MIELLTRSCNFIYRLSTFVSISYDDNGFYFRWYDMTDFLAVIHYLHILLIKCPIVSEQNIIMNKHVYYILKTEINLPFPFG